MSLRKAIDRPIHVRPPAVAGRFYPADPGKLRRFITEAKAVGLFLPEHHGPLVAADADRNPTA